MKASAALLAGLLAGLALGGVSHAQSSSVPIVVLQDEEEEPSENPVKGISPKAARCAMACQAPSYQCYESCGQETATQACMNKCKRKNNACLEECGVDPKKLQPPKSK